MSLTGEAGNAASPALGAMLDSTVVEPAITEPGVIATGNLTNLETGRSWRYVCLSTLADEDDRRRVVDWLGGAAQIGETQVYDDPDMIGGTAEQTMWEA